MNSARERGAALLVAVLMVAALAGIAAAVVLAVAGGGSMARNEQWGETAAARAEAGLEFAKTVLAAHARAADGSLEAALRRRGPMSRRGLARAGGPLSRATGAPVVTRAAPGAATTNSSSTRRPLAGRRASTWAGS